MNSVPGLSKHDSNPKVMFLIRLRRLALANEDKNMVELVDQELADYEEFLYTKEDEKNQLDDYYSKIEEMENRSEPFKHSRYKNPNTIGDLATIRDSDKYRTEDRRIKDYLQVYDRIFEISYINKDFTSYEIALKQYKNDSFLKDRKQHRREYFKLNKQFKEQKEKSIRCWNILPTMKKFLSSCFLNIFTKKKHFMHRILFQGYALI